MPLTLQEAQTVITGAHERAAKIAALITVAVVDEGGHLQALGRMNGAAPLSAQIAETKAASVALFRRDGTALRQLQEANPGFFAQLDRAVRVPILAGAGAAPFMRPRACRCPPSSTTATVISAAIFAARSCAPVMTV